MPIGIARLELIANQQISKSNIKGCSLNADILNVFSNRFDKPSDTPVLPSVLLHCDEFFSFEEVYSMKYNVLFIGAKNLSL